MRVIARIDVKNDFVIKGIHLEGLRKVGNPNEFARRYYDEGIHEIVFMDAVASLYDRNNLFGVIERACQDVFVPIALGGGIRTIEDISKALSAGADKVVINTGAVRNIGLIKQASTIFGSQCIVGSIEAKRVSDGWKVYIDNGREPTNLDVLEWAKELELAGIGELMVTSIDQEGTKRGFDLPLVGSLYNAVSLPIIVSGGYGDTKHVVDVKKTADVGAIAVASVLHYNLDSVENIKAHGASLEEDQR